MLALTAGDLPSDASVKKMELNGKMEERKLRSITLKDKKKTSGGGKRAHLLIEAKGP